MKDIKNFIAETNESVSKKRMLKEGLEGTDAIDEAITNAADVVADEYFMQNGQQEMADTHGEDGDDTWYDLREALRNAMLEAIDAVCNGNK